MLLSKLNSVGAIFISCPEAADVIRRIARRESVAKGRERFTLLLQPILPSLSPFSPRTPSSFLSSIALLTRRLCIRMHVVYYLPVFQPSPSYPPLLLPDVSSLVLAVKISSSVRHLPRCPLYRCASSISRRLFARDNYSLLRKREYLKEKQPTSSPLLRYELY